MTQINIGGNIGISELFFCVMAPVFLIQDQATIKRDGFGPIVWLSFLTIVGCAIACYSNQTPLPFALKGYATTYVTFASILFYHHFLRQNLDGVKWVLLGFAISNVINVFAFHYGAEGAAFAQGYKGLEAAQSIAGGTLFWINRLSHWLLLPVKGWYLATPTIYSAFIPVGLAVYAIMGTASGRSAALGVLGGCAFVLIGAKSCRRMRFISRHFVTFLLVACCGAVFLKGVYTYLGKNNLLSEKQQQKFMSQTSGGTRTSTLQILMAGRTEFFAGLYAAIRRPIVGYGPWPIDKENIYQDFVLKYGNVDDIEGFFATMEYMAQHGKFGLLPSHSIIVEFWHWYSVFGLIFWIYILRQMYIYLRRDIDVVPQWFGYLAMTMPSMLWNVFFSPYGGRTTFALYFVVLMFNRAVARGRIALPPKMMREKQKCMKN